MQGKTHFGFREIPLPKTDVNSLRKSFLAQNGGETAPFEREWKDVARRFGFDPGRFGFNVVKGVAVERPGRLT